MMSKLSFTVHGNVSAVADTIENGFCESGLSCELVDRVSRNVNGGQVRMLVFEKYMWRVSNRVSLTVMLCGNGDTVTVDAIGSGAGQGAFLFFTWGAEDNLVNKVEEILRNAGYLR